MRRSWQSNDHDGLLGSGSFPRPSGFAAGMMASKGRGDDHFQLKKSNEPYHPPRPYKVMAVRICSLLFFREGLFRFHLVYYSTVHIL